MDSPRAGLLVSRVCIDPPPVLPLEVLWVTVEAFTLTRSVHQGCPLAPYLDVQLPKIDKHENLNAHLVW